MCMLFLREYLSAGFTKKVGEAKREIQFLRDVVNKSGWKPDPEKIQAIEEMPAPKIRNSLNHLWEWLVIILFFQKCNQ